MRMKILSRVNSITGTQESIGGPFKYIRNIMTAFQISWPHFKISQTNTFNKLVRRLLQPTLMFGQVGTFFQDRKMDKANVEVHFILMSQHMRNISHNIRFSDVLNFEASSVGGTKYLNTSSVQQHTVVKFVKYAQRGVSWPTCHFSCAQSKLYHTVTTYPCLFLCLYVHNVLR